MKVRDCERDGYKLWGDQLLFDWLTEEPDQVTRHTVLAWVLALVEAPVGVECTPVPSDDVDAVCAFVPETEVVVTWILDAKSCIVWIIEVESLADLGG